MTSSAATQLRVEPLAGALGAEVHGVDLAQPMAEDVFEQVRDALMRHLVLFFRDQDITARQFRDFARRFGPLQIHPAYLPVEGVPEVGILESTPEVPTKIEQWHTDMTFRPDPPMATLLHAQIVPEVGGDTQWASMYAAFEGLSSGMRRLLDGLTAEHSFAHGFQESLAEPGGYERLRNAIRDNPPVRHPVIRTHPVTGRKGIFVNSLFTTRIIELNARESRAVLEMLWDHLRQPEYTVRFRWRPRSLAFWDNRVTQHQPVNDYFPAHRRMHRAVIAGDHPV